MTKKVRLNLTNEEKMAQDIVGMNNDQINFHMSEGKIEDIINREKASKFNEQVDAYTEKLQNHISNLQKVAEDLGTSPELVEIKPMFNRILVKPFAQESFSKN